MPGPTYMLSGPLALHIAHRPAPLPSWFRQAEDFWVATEVETLRLALAADALTSALSGSAAARDPGVTGGEAAATDDIDDDGGKAAEVGVGMGRERSRKFPPPLSSPPPTRGAEGSSNTDPPRLAGGYLALHWTHGHYRDYPAPDRIPIDFCRKDPPCMLGVQVPNPGFNESYRAEDVFCSAGRSSSRGRAWGGIGRASYRQ